MSPRRWFILATGFVSVAVLGLIVASFAHWGGVQLEDSVHFVAEIIAGSLAGVACLIAARRSRGRMTVVWACLSVYASLSAAGEAYALWNTLIARHTLVFPSAADWLFLAEVPVAIVAALILIRGSTTRLGVVASMLDALLVGLGLLVVGLATVLDPIVGQLAKMPFATAVSLAEPVTDVMVLALVGTVVLRAARQARILPALVFLGVAGLAVADGAMTYMGAAGVDATGSTFQIGWTAGLLGIGLAAVYAICFRSSATPRIAANRRTGQAVFLPILPTAVASALVIVDFLDDGAASGFVMWSMVALIAPTLARMCLSLYMNLGLSRSLEHQASHDDLTGLPNRAFLRRNVESSLSGGRTRDRVALLVVDLDGFKGINDTFGHGAGDEVLVKVAQDIVGCVRGNDLVARLGGDEFAVMLADASDEAIKGIGRRILSSLELPIRLSTVTVSVNASIGAATTRDGHSAEELLRNADMAMYAAKTAGGGRLAMYEPSMHEAVSERLELETSLRTAWLNDTLIVQYQPIVDLQSGRMVSVEALARLRGADGSMIPPARFIQVAEQTGAIVPLGARVLTEACRRLAAWQQSHAAASELSVSVNVSPRQLRSDDLVQIVAEALRSTRIRPDLLILEVTETAVTEDMDGAVRTLTRLKELGVRIALDDFGVGASSLARLRRLPVDIVKIDKSLIDQIPDGQMASKLLDAVVGVVRALQLRVVIEGVERSDQAAHLRQAGYDLAQGFYFARPVHGDVIETALADSRLPSEAPGSVGTLRNAAAADTDRPDRVLVVEDNAALATAACRILERDGMQAVHTPTMRGALTELWKGRVDALIVDINLPDGDGWQLVGSLRSKEKHAHVPVVVMTGLIDSAEVLNRTAELRCEYLGKPFAREALVHKLHSARKLVATAEVAA